MNMDNKSYITKKVESIDTKELENILISSKNKTNKVLKDNENLLIYDDKKFSCYIKDKIKEKGMTIKDVVFIAGCSESYGRQVISQDKHAKNRDLIIKICIAAKLSLNEMNRALKLYGLNGLYAKDKRDALIMIEINNGNNSIEKINQILETNDLPILSTKEESE